MPIKIFVNLVSILAGIKMQDLDWVMCSKHVGCVPYPIIIARDREISLGSSLDHCWIIVGSRNQQYHCDSENVFLINRRFLSNIETLICNLPLVNAPGSKLISIMYS